MFRECLSLKRAVILVELDKLKNDHQKHQSEIHAKLVTRPSQRTSKVSTRSGGVFRQRRQDTELLFVFRNPRDNVSPRRHQSQTFGRGHQEPAGSLLSRQKNVYLQTRYLHKKPSTRNFQRTHHPLRDTRHQQACSHHACLPIRPLPYNLTTVSVDGE
ncbi:hypothetical protein EDB89DRAFT_698336 [Lactarius sanguifluus]|nr:hypothetical protein EDB89DRAFT_698336 [Lactarius sanguifluus]